ncbi:hypothetical protein P7K49_031671 [Saguinus oedipus]|uniref:Retinol-binding protein 2 n=1 Tax=Saguinus oedipus TaxID=9490 RepID=A0ABQ9U0Z6_SAGOE|nr:hypothetical protein P7K49_031671 [Saguinus oedipus]
MAVRASNDILMAEEDGSPPKRGGKQGSHLPPWDGTRGCHARALQANPRTLKRARKATCELSFSKTFKDVRFRMALKEEETFLFFRKHTLVTWEGDALVCEQKGEKENRGWKQWVEGGKLYLELTCGDQVCRQVFKKK